MVRIGCEEREGDIKSVCVINMLSTGPGRDDTPKKIESEEKK